MTDDTIHGKAERTLARLGIAPAPQRDDLQPAPAREQSVTIVSALTGRRYVHVAPLNIEVESPTGRPLKVTITEPFGPTICEDGRTITVYDAVETISFHPDPITHG